MIRSDVFDASDTEESILPWMESFGSVHASKFGVQKNRAMPIAVVELDIDGPGIAYVTSRFMRCAYHPGNLHRCDQ